MRTILSTDLNEDRSGIATIVAVIIIVAVIAVAGAGVYFLTKDNGSSNKGNPSENGADFDEPGLNTWVKYKITGDEQYTSMKITFIGLGEKSETDKTLQYIQCMEGTKDKQTESMIIKDDAETVMPDGAKKTGNTETLDTTDGKIVTDIYATDDGVYKIWVGQDDSGKKNNAIYKVTETEDGKTVTTVLDSYDLKKFNGYTPSSQMFTTYATYDVTLGLLTGTSVAKYVGESDTNWFIDLEDTSDSVTVDEAGIVPVPKSTSNMSIPVYKDLGSAKITIGPNEYTAEKWSLSIEEAGTSLTNTLYIEKNTAQLYRLDVALEYEKTPMTMTYTMQMSS